MVILKIHKGVGVVLTSSFWCYKKEAGQKLASK